MPESKKVFLKVAVCPQDSEIPISGSVRVMFLYGSVAPRYVEVGDWFRRRLERPLEHRDHLAVREHSPEGLEMHLNDGKWSVEESYLEAWFSQAFPQHAEACGQ